MEKKYLMTVDELVRKSDEDIEKLNRGGNFYTERNGELRALGEYRSFRTITVELTQEEYDKIRRSIITN